jgi:hypothetical protein
MNPQVEVVTNKETPPMLRTAHVLLLVGLALCGCHPSRPLSDFSEIKVFWSDQSRDNPGEQIDVWLELSPCLPLTRDARLRINGKEVEMHYGKVDDLLITELCYAPLTHLPLSREDLAEPRDVRFELSDGESTVVVEIANYFSERRYVPRQLPLRTGQVNVFDFIPGTDVFPSTPSFFLKDAAGRLVIVPHTQDASGARLDLTQYKGTGPHSVHYITAFHPQVLRCEGIASCNVHGYVDRIEPITIEPGTGTVP